MTDSAEMLTADQERRLAINLFNRVWDLLDADGERSVAAEDEMVHAAHASRYHWGNVGEPVNRIRGEWQISRVYAVLGRAEPALHHAHRCLQLCEESGIGDFAFAQEALARAHHVAGNEDEADAHTAKAAELGAQIADDDDRDHFFEELATIGG
ncbi:MAG: hypothetical protein ACRD0U_13665 [Acidimicrobiales bacterium]